MSRHPSTRTRVFLFDDLQQAHHAVNALVAQGARPQDLGLITHDALGHAMLDPGFEGRVEPLDPIQTRTFSERAAKNGARGALVGGLVGMLGGLAALTIPGAGALLFLGTVGGAMAGGVLSALSTHVLHEHEAVVFDEALRRGGHLLFVHDEAATMRTLGELMVASGAAHLASRVATWRAQGWTGYTPPAAPDDVQEAPEPPREEFFQHLDPNAEDPWVRAHWARLVPAIQGVWPKLTEADAADIAGHRGRLVVHLNALYDQSQEAINWRLDEILAEVLGTAAIQDSPSAHHAWSLKDMDHSVTHD